MEPHLIARQGERAVYGSIVHNSQEPLIDVQLVANSVLYIDSLPLNANVLFDMVMANQMPFVGRG